MKPFIESEIIAVKDEYSVLINRCYGEKVNRDSWRCSSYLDALKLQLDQMMNSLHIFTSVLADKIKQEQMVAPPKSLWFESEINEHWKFGYDWYIRSIEDREQEIKLFKGYVDSKTKKPVAHAYYEVRPFVDCYLNLKNQAKSYLIEYQKKVSKQTSQAA